MEKLELKHLRSYLDHDLRCNIIGLDKKNYNNVELTSLSTKSTYECACFVDDEDMRAEISMIHIENIKPILNPLSSLTDEVLKKIYNDNDIDIVRMKYQIVINYKLMGEWFKDVINLRQIFNGENSNLTMPAWLFLELIKRHYDVFLLIPKDLAIDKNTL